MTKIQDVKTKIENLKITMNKAIIIQVFNFLDSFFVQFLDILSYKSRKKDKVLTLKMLDKFLKYKKL